VATLTPSDRAAIEAQVLAITHDLLRELGNRTAIEALKGSANLERDLGLASIERVELISRIEQSLGTSLPEGAIADAIRLDDIIAAVTGPRGTGSADAKEQAPARPPNGAQPNPGAIQSGLGQTSSETRTQGFAAAEATYDQGGRFWRILQTIYGIYAATI